MLATTIVFQIPTKTITKTPAPHLPKLRLFPRAPPRRTPPRAQRLWPLRHRKNILQTLTTNLGHQLLALLLNPANPAPPATFRRQQRRLPLRRLTHQAPMRTQNRPSLTHTVGVRVRMRVRALSFLASLRTTVRSRRCACRLHPRRLRPRRVMRS